MSVFGTQRHTYPCKLHCLLLIKITFWKREAACNRIVPAYQGLALHMGSQGSFLPAVICTLEKALDSYSSDTDPANPPNRLLWCAPFACEKQTWTFTVLQRGGLHFPRPSQKGNSKVAATGATQPLCQPRKWAPWRPMKRGLICIKTSPSVSMTGTGLHRRNLLFHDTIKSRVSSHCHWSICWCTNLAFTSVPPVSTTAFTWRYMASMDQVQWLW